MRKSKRKIIAMMISAFMVVGTLPIKANADTTTVDEGGYFAYVPATTIETNEEYLILDNSNTYALKNNDGTVGAETVNVSNIYDSSVTNHSSLLWTFSENVGEAEVIAPINIVNGEGNYLNKGNSNLWINTEGYKWAVNNQGKGDYRIGANSEYVTYFNETFTKTKTVTTVKLYKKVVVTNPTVHFPVTMYNYSASKVNAEAQRLLNGETDPTKMQAFRFNTGNGGSENINWNKQNPRQGLAKDQLSDDGKFQFNDKIASSDIFDTTTNTELGRTVYNGIQFPFVHSLDGYYTFDSSKVHTHLNTTGGDNQTLDLHEGAQKVGKYGTFFPFNKDGSTKPDYHFGMNMGVNFFMTEDGKIEDPITREPKDVVFEFSGDDDVWVFVDGNLVLDLGGIHGVMSGDINFATGKINYAQDRVDMYGQPITTAVPNLYEMYEGLTLEKLADGKEHNLQIFYLERGSNISNCKIRFNLPQRDVLEITKQLEENTPQTKDDFKFKVEFSKNDKTYVPYSNKGFALYNGQSLVESNFTTDGNGEFSIKAGQKVRFADPGVGYYRITEIGADEYTTSWKVGESNLESGNSTVVQVVEQIGTTVEAKTYTVACINEKDFEIADDVIVLDYGKAVEFDVLKNDNLEGVDAELYSLSAEETDRNKVVLPQSHKTDEVLNLTNGNLELASDGVVRYTPTKFMDSIDKAEYAVKYAVGNGIDEGTTRYKYANIAVIPATTVYYEDDFGTDENGENGSIIFSGNWTTVFEGADTSDTLQDNGTVNEDDHPYGYDSSYENDSNFSGGSATLIQAPTDSNGTASFVFKGTGFDIISRTDNETGTIIVRVSKNNEDGSKTFVKQTIVNTVYQNDGGILYQIPVMKIVDLPYGEYTAEIIVAKGNAFYLDALRIYNPLGTTSEDNEDFEEGNNQYLEDNEANANIKEVRNLLIAAETFKYGEENPGVVFVDGTAGAEATMSDYKNVGPNNEVYLAPGQSIAFKVKATTKAASVQIGMKAPNGLTNVKISDGLDTSETRVEKSINTATDMYYDITPVVYGLDGISGTGIVVITNTAQRDENDPSKNMISITNLKATFATVGEELVIVSDNDTVDAVLGLGNN